MMMEQYGVYLDSRLTDTGSGDSARESAVADIGWRIFVKSTQHLLHLKLNTMKSFYGNQITNVVNGDWVKASVRGFKMKFYQGGGWSLDLRSHPNDDDDFGFVTQDVREGRLFRAWVVLEDDPVLVDAVVFDPPVIWTRCSSGQDNVKCVLRYNPPPPSSETCYIVLFHSAGSGSRYKRGVHVRWGDDQFRHY